MFLSCYIQIWMQKFTPEIATFSTMIKERTRGGHTESKRWAIIFTCMSTRAVHIEVIETMNTVSLVSRLRCFNAIKGLDEQISLDPVMKANATQQILS